MDPLHIILLATTLLFLGLWLMEGRRSENEKLKSDARHMQRTVDADKLLASERAAFEKAMKV